MKPTQPDVAMSDRRFDRAMQSRYLDAAENVSAHTQAQLRIRLNAAVSPSKGRYGHRPAWRVAAAFLLVLVAVIGLRMRTPEPPLPAQGAANVDVDNGDLLASLEEAPDLYLWLASDDASALVSE